MGNKKLPVDEAYEEACRLVKEKLDKEKRTERVVYRTSMSPTPEEAIKKSKAHYPHDGYNSNKIGTGIFWVIHILLFLFFIPGLIVSIPLHLLISFGNDIISLGDRLSSKRCDACKSLIPKDASKCRYCGERSIAR